MRQVPLWICFTLALLFMLFGTVFFPQIRIWPFTPFLVFVFHRVRFYKALWISFFCGLLLDLFSSQFRFGLFAFSHVATTFLFYKQKKHFFEDKALSLSLFTAFLSAFLSLFLFLLCIRNEQITASFSTFFSSFIVMPCLDALYAFFWFTCPISLYAYFKKHGLSFFLPKTEDLT